MGVGFLPNTQSQDTQPNITYLQLSLPKEKLIGDNTTKHINFKFTFQALLYNKNVQNHLWHLEIDCQLIARQPKKRILCTKFCIPSNTKAVS